MQKAKLISPVTKQGIKRTRVCAYCRVSTNSADQLNSYAAQIRVYTKMIKEHPEWELVEIFADEGISGMKADNREEFQRMIRLCELKQIELILTKLVSRFARNVKEALSYVRELKLLGVGVQFEKEGINTLSMGDEMLLNTFSAIAQEESKAISQHQRLSIVKRMESGEYVDSNAPYGYRLVEKKLAIYEPEAEIVRSIFQLYLNGWSTSEIARELTRCEVTTKTGKDEWRANKVSFILSNEKYVGDSRYQKTFRDTTVPFKQFTNRGQEDMFYATETHPPLISRETFDQVQALLSKRKEQFARTEELTIYPLTSRIRCSECGSFYHRKIRGGIVKWVCSSHSKDSRSCDSFYYSEERIYDGIISMFNKLRFGEEDILGHVIAKLEHATTKYKQNNKTAQEASVKMAELKAKLLMLDQLRSKGYLAAEVYQAQSRDINKQISILKADRQMCFDSHILDMLEKVKKLKSLLGEIEEPMEEFDEHLFPEVVQEIRITKRDEMEVTLRGGLRFTERI